MVGSRTVLMFVLGLGMAGALATPAMAQAGGGGGGGGGGRGGRNGGGAGGAGGGQRFDPAAMMQRREQQLKESLGVTDEEWTALQPKLQKVQEAQMAVRAGTMFGGRGGRGGGGPAADNATTQGPYAIAASELRTTLDNKDSTPDQIKAKLQALRDARDKANADVTAAQAELKSLLTARQEAVLVSQGVLN